MTSRRKRRTSKHARKAATSRPRDLSHALEVTFRLLQYRPRTEAELRQALQRRGFPSDVVAQAVALAQEEGWINDAAFAQLWVESRIRHHPRARWVLERELRAKGLPESLIYQALETIDDATLARTALEQVWRRYRALPWPEARRKLAADLARRGFSGEIVMDVLTQWAAEQGWPATLDDEEHAP